jgi:hypothetical protein
MKEKTQLYWTLDIVKALGVKGKLLYDWKQFVGEEGIIPFRDAVKWAIQQERNDPSKKGFVKFIQMAKYLDVFIDNQPKKTTK